MIVAGQLTNTGTIAIMPVEGALFSDARKYIHEPEEAVAVNE